MKHAKRNVSRWAMPFAGFATLGIFVGVAMGGSDGANGLEAHDVSRYTFTSVVTSASKLDESAYLADLSAIPEVSAPADTEYNFKEDVPQIEVSLPPEPEPTPTPTPEPKQSTVEKAQEEKKSEEPKQEAAVVTVVPAGEAQNIAHSILTGEYGWSEGEFTCLVNLWQKESNWRHTAENTSSGAYGIPQSLPGNKMASVGSDWRTNPETQIRWGLGYIQGRYGTPCGAWEHSERKGWY